jgi:transposase
MAKNITWWTAAEIIGVSDRTMRRWRERMEEQGYAGLADRRKGKPSAQRIPLVTVEKLCPPLWRRFPPVAKEVAGG